MEFNKAMKASILQAGAELCQAQLYSTNNLVTSQLLASGQLEHADAAYLTPLCLLSQLKLGNKLSEGGGCCIK